MRSYSRISITFLFLFILALFFSFGIWKSNRIKLDAPSYYTYLPAFFIQHDLRLNYIDKDPEHYRDKVWFYRIENGQKLIKHPMGISVMLSPFFILGHLTAKITNSVQDGYSLPYQNWVSIGVLIWLFLGLYYLRKLLLEWFSDAITAITLVAIVIGTNLLWYSTQEGLMPHAVTFSVWCFALYSFFNWLKRAEKKLLFCFAVSFGLIVLIRPLSIAGILYFVLYGIISKGGIKAFVDFLRPQLKDVLLASLIAILIASLQLFYWKYATGHWFYDVYRDEHFLFNDPEIFLFLFSFRKGVFVYTPILIFAVIGLIIFFRKNKAFFWSTLLFMSLTIYLLASWWAWSYGICWGMRPMIDYYALLSFPMAAGFSYFFEGGRMKKLFASAALILIIILNLFQTWQYKNGAIHYDDMSREAYFYDFFRTKPTPEWADFLKPYDWDRRIAGLEQVEYSPQFLREVQHDIVLRGANLMYIGINERAQNAMAALLKDPTELSKFYLKFEGADKAFSLHSGKGLFWSLRSDAENAITASEQNVKASEVFQIEYAGAGNDNRIAIKAPNGKYVSIGDEWPFILKANADHIGKNEIFRYFALGK
ncbi:MAG: hypothetical protein ACJ77K_06855 [Bacteroidia bacterium]